MEQSESFYFLDLFLIFNILILISICMPDEMRSFPDLFPEIIGIKNNGILTVSHGPVDNVLLTALYLNDKTVRGVVRRFDLYFRSESINDFA